MPKIRPLTQRGRDAEAELMRNEIFSEKLRTAYGRIKKTDVQITAATNVSQSSLYNIKHPERVSLARFGIIRDVAHEIGLTADEWLRLGGFAK